MRSLVVLIVAVLLLVVPAAAEGGRRLVLAVTPILLDESTPVGHGSRDQVLQLIRSHSQGHEQYLIQRLTKGGRFFDVRPVKAVAPELFPALIAGSQVAGTGESEARLYQFDPAGVQQLVGTVVAERLLVLVYHGEMLQRIRWDRNKIDYLNNRYGSMMASAYLLDAAGQVLWRYTPSKDEEPFLWLQYPNFDDAYYNKTNQVPLVDLKLAGLERHLVEKETTVFNRPSNTPRRYKEWMDQVVDQLHQFLGP